MIFSQRGVTRRWLCGYPLNPKSRDVGQICWESAFGQKLKTPSAPPRFTLLVLSLAIHGGKCFLPVPLFLRPEMPPAELTGLLLTNHAAALAESRTVSTDPAGQEQSLHIAIAVAETVEGPDIVPDTLTEEAMLLISVCYWVGCHAVSMPYDSEAV
jgi:hypothetical protein